MSFSEIYEEHRRLIILRALENSKIGPSCNDSILQTICIEFGCRSSRDQVKSAATWLEEQGLVKNKVQESGTYIITITQRGAEVATGILTVPGVKRPSPGELHG
ncbi:MAG: ArsR family transcriptional regulator [Geobacter sp.]|nr:MAG: ArsR family transcriptional regulator [Geobacter sp.]